jgi:hypothetical protein
MNPEKRESLIQQLTLVSGYSAAYFKNLTDREIRKEMERYYGKDYRTESG